MMKTIIHICYLMMTFFIMSCFSAEKQSKKEDKNTMNCCLDSSINDGYNRQKVFTEFANTLNLLVPEWGIDKKGFFVSKKCQLVGAFVWDITDTLNKETTLDECIALKEGHIYHFSPIRNIYSYSNIAVLNQGAIKIFKAVNCPGQGDRIEDAIQYIRNYLSTSADNESIIERVINYRRYGIYIKTDEQSEFKCK